MYRSPCRLHPLHWFVGPVLVLAVAGCQDRTGPAPDAATLLDVTADSLVAVTGGAVLVPLEARDRDGNPIAQEQLGARGLTLTVVDTAVARVVSPDSVAGIAPGRTTLVARLGELADTVPLRVLPPVAIASAPLAAGDDFTCVIDGAGAVWCWGKNGGGQLDADPDSVPFSGTPLRVQGLPPAVAVSGGTHHACALTADGDAYCWGDNTQGELGDGTPGERASPVLVTGAHTWARIAAADDNTCGLTVSGEAYCWGLGKTAPTRVGDSYVALSAGSRTACAIEPVNGFVICWGVIDPRTGQSWQYPTPLLNKRRYTAVSAGGAGICGITDVGAGICTLTPLHGLGDVVGSLPFAQIAVGRGVGNDGHACGIGTDGTAYCWGSDEFGQLGDGDGDGTGSVVQVATTQRFTAIGAGVRHSCGLTADGGVLCWGSDRYGQLGDGHPDGRPTPAHVTGGLSFVRLVASAADVDGSDGEIYGITAAGSLWSWGAGRVVPTQVSVPSPITDFAAIYHEALVSHHYTPADYPVVLASDSLAYALADSSWQPVSTSLKFVHVQAGGDRICGLTADRFLYCWNESKTPERVFAVQPYVDMANGHGHVCALGEDGQAYCWGNNDFGQLGDGTTTTRDLPTTVTGGHAFVAIAASGYSTCGVTTGGSVLCWGYNYEFEIGSSPGFTHRAEPAPIDVDATGFTAVTGYADHFCALTAAGEAWCWGRGTEGQLGDGRYERDLPVRVASPVPFTAVTAGINRTCGLTADGSAYCWGKPPVGDGTPPYVSLPAPVDGGPYR